MTSDVPAAELSEEPITWTAVAADALLLTLAFFLVAGWPPPDVNEAHYLAKAKHYWQPQWCEGDIFLESGDAHLTFYWVFGWVTRFLSLAATAWLGRFISWAAIAAAWTLLNRDLQLGRLWSLLSGVLMIALIERAHMAGEWLVGGVEAKSFAFPLVLFGLREAVLARWRWAGLWMGAATAMHVLVGGWSWIALSLAWLLIGRDEQKLRQLLPLWSLSAVIALGGVLPGLNLGGQATAVERALAHQIYVFERLSHHLVFHRFPHLFMLRHGLLVTLWAWLAIALRHEKPVRRLNAFIAGAIGIAICGVVIDQSLLMRPQWSAALLRFYWFRLADVVAPLGVGLMACLGTRRLQIERPLLGQWLSIVLILLAAAHVLDVYIEAREDMRPAAVKQPLHRRSMSELSREEWFRDWRNACDWIDANTARDALFITPRHQQTFKWYAQRAEVVNWKDVPQDARGLIEWRDRMRRVHRPRLPRAGLIGHGSYGLRRLGERYQADYVVVDQSLTNRRLMLPQVYPASPRENSTFVIYRLPPKP